MKTSNKLLTGLFVIVIIGMIIANFTLKEHIDTNTNPDVKVEVNAQDSTATFNNDSVAMDKAIGNE